MYIHTHIVYISPTWAKPISRLEQHWEFPSNSSLESQLGKELGKGPKQCVYPMGETSDAALQAPTFNPRPQADIIISLHAEMQL